MNVITAIQYQTPACQQGVTVLIRLVELDDVPALCRIYNYYIEHTITTFEEITITPEELAHRISIVTRHFPWLVYENQGEPLGFAYGNFWKTRAAYSQTVETTIYVDHDHTGQGIGGRLYPALLNRLAHNGRTHTIVACVSLPNDSSVALHEKLGFREVGRFREVGKKFGRWIDIGYWQLPSA